MLRAYGTNLRGGTPICNFLRCKNLRSSAGSCHAVYFNFHGRRRICQNLRFLQRKSVGFLRQKRFGLALSSWIRNLNLALNITASVKQSLHEYNFSSLPVFSACVLQSGSHRGRSECMRAEDTETLEDMDVFRFLSATTLQNPSPSTQ